MHRVPSIPPVREPPPPCRARGAARPCCTRPAARRDVAAGTHPSELVLKLGVAGTSLEVVSGREGRALALGHGRARGCAGAAAWVPGGWSRVLPGLRDERGGGGGVVGARGGRGVLLDVADSGGEGGRAAGGVLEGGEVVVEV